MQALMFFRLFYLIVQTIRITIFKCKVEADVKGNTHKKQRNHTQIFFFVLLVYSFLNWGNTDKNFKTHKNFGA
jgi:hypothetical protein